MPRQNGRLAGLLGATFPDHDIDDIDVFESVRRRPDHFLAATTTGAAANLGPLLRRRLRPKGAFVTSSGYARAARSVVAARVSAATHAFSFQSQSQVPVAVAGVPNFVYTDHAHLTNLDYPGFDRANLAGAGYLRREAEIYSAAAMVFTFSTHVRDTLVHAYGHPPERVAVVGVGPNAVGHVRRDDAWFGGRIAFIGVDWERKGGPVLIDAFRRLREERPSARLEIIGCTPPVADGDGVTVHGMLSGDDVSRLLAECDVFCLPTRAEPFGVAFIEAMHARLPIIGPQLGAAPDLVDDGAAGWLVPPDDSGALQKALLDAVDRPAVTLQKGARAQALAVERYTWDVVMARIKKHIDNCLTATASRSAAAAVGHR